jgi:hypothetical protein
LFFDFLRLIKAAGYNNFLVLVDEFEFLATLGDHKIVQVLNTFREIFDDFGGYYQKYDAKIAKPLFMFAVSPGGWERLTNLETALTKKTGGAGIAPFMRRLNPRYRIVLDPFTSEKTLELVKTRLEESRTKKSEDPLYPFTGEAVDYIHSLSLFRPGNSIQYCGIVLEDALIENIGIISLLDAKRILKKYGISSNEAGFNRRLPLE